MATTLFSIIRRTQYKLVWYIIQIECLNHQ